ncbi:hypothetical protein NSK11_contig00004-0125 [Nocardia seriolae]|uniref:Uncharacterized protein n=1 Tax=Nocardia seriolae TaxID=37332 RepID=A0ABC9YL72_9NOCA|nr:hypothetical protein NSERKGN1266_67470 [Nocardia seriolae]BEK93482.1 hypothetical protein NSER024013_13880 [Nocardia seriolae]GAM46640.1 hypothetical protein NS07_v2contig00034-0037 [Nocardia seriolae]GAP26269.1 hypothetical protein NSK11_contig00004-0125 [Nocardia seriolae]GEM21871.1 hypothetical protein NS2_01100 [Nocardia seriolae NBRC 15557]
MIRSHIPVCNAAPSLHIRVAVDHEPAEGRAPLSVDSSDRGMAESGHPPNVTYALISEVQKIYQPILNGSP